MPQLLAVVGPKDQQRPGMFRGLTTEYFLRPLRGLWKYSSVRSRAPCPLIARKRSAQAVGSGLKERSSRRTMPARRSRLHAARAAHSDWKAAPFGV